MSRKTLIGTVGNLARCLGICDTPIRTMGGIAMCLGIDFAPALEGICQVMGITAAKMPQRFSAEGPIERCT